MFFFFFTSSRTRIILHARVCVLSCTKTVMSYSYRICEIITSTVDESVSDVVVVCVTRVVVVVHWYSRWDSIRNGLGRVMRMKRERTDRDCGGNVEREYRLNRVWRETGENEAS